MQDIERLSSIEGIEDLIVESSKHDVWILKHSLICPVSTAGLREFEKFVEARDSSEGTYVLEIQRAREVSAEVTARLGVRHESPQALLLRDGEVAWHGSHWDITRQGLAAA